MHHQQRTSRRPVILIAVTAAVTAVLVAAAIAGLAYASSSSSDRASSRPTPSSSSSVDQAAHLACHDAFRSGEGVDDESDTAMRQALEAAGASSVTALRDIRARYAPGGQAPDYLTLRKGALAIARWCEDHRVS